MLTCVVKTIVELIHIPVLVLKNQQQKQNSENNAANPSCLKEREIPGSGDGGSEWSHVKCAKHLKREFSNFGI